MPQVTEFKAGLKAGTLVLAASLAGSLALAGCTQKAPPALPPAPQPTTVSEAPAASTVSTPAPGSQADFAAQLMGQDTILFDTDKFDIDQADAAALRAQAQWLARYPGKRATIEGHCDERGTREYNLALGERRANAAKNYLASLGVDASRLTTISYGKERPVALGSDEASWARNRRAVTVTVD
ncbi:peptidoglycan-associated lipoprotein Pal [Novosphingobium bradum]|uniref:Peptidoglycan-associated protein n=1 Tax=Novosphingobium bradum TaxID=1737444 RepID=A0ABV7IYJ6_9SPHN